MCIVKLRYNIQYGVNTMSTIISTHVFITFSQYFKIFYTNIRIRKSAPDTESLSERSDIRTPNDIPNIYALHVVGWRKILLRYCSAPVSATKYHVIK